MVVECEERRQAPYGKCSDQIITMKALTILCFLLGLQEASAQNLPETQKVYCNLSVTYEVNPRIGSRYMKTVTGLGTGTCWAAKVDGQPVLFTAAHVLARGPNFSVKPLERAELQFLQIKPIIGLLGHELQSVGLPKGNPDWVALRPKDAGAFKNSRLKELSKIVPKAGDSLVVIGFPDTAHEQRVERTVTSIGLNGDYIVFNQPLDHGYSGGVVLNGKGQAVGLVVTTAEKQSTAVLLTMERLKSLDWKPFEEIRKRTFDQ